MTGEERQLLEGIREACSIELQYLQESIQREIKLSVEHGILTKQEVKNLNSKELCLISWGMRRRIASMMELLDTVLDLAIAEEEREKVLNDAFKKLTDFLEKLDEQRKEVMWLDILDSLNSEEPKN